MIQQKSLPLTLAFALFCLAIPGAWASEACGGQERQLKASQRRLDSCDHQIEQAEIRVDRAQEKLEKAVQTGETLVSNASLRVKSAKTLSSAIARACGRQGSAPHVGQKPKKVTYRGRQYVCSVRLTASLTRGVELAKVALSRAQSRAQTLEESADNFLARMQQRAQKYQDSRAPLLLARDNDKAALEACLGTQQPAPIPSVEDTKPVAPGPAAQPNPVPVRDLASHIFLSLFALAKEEQETTLISRYVHPFKWIRNSNVWARSWDFTGLAVNINGIGGVGGGTLITRKHVFLSNHVPYPELPATIHFVDSNSNYAEYKIINVKQVGGTDMKIGELDREVDPSFKVYKLLPANYRRWLPGAFHVLFSDFEKKALIGELTQLHNLQDGVVCEVAESSSSSLSLYFEMPTGGDSGNPVFTIIENEPVLIGGWSRLWGSRTAVATFIPDHYDAINEAIQSLNPGYRAQEVNLSSFDAPGAVISR